MKRKIKFLYDGSWTNWFDMDNLPEEIKTLNFSEVIIEEEMTKEQYEDYMRSFNA